MYIVYTEIDNEKWFYGIYESYERAAEVRMMLGREEHGITKAENWEEENIQNVPRYAKEKV